VAQDKGEKLKFGIFAIQTGTTFTQALELARRGEQLGLHSLWVADHMWNLANPERDYLECLTLMAGLLARTDRIRIGALVICSLFRNPALLAKMLCSLDHIGQGRLEFGLGAGWMRQEFLAYGYDYPPIGVRLRRLDETLAIVKSMFTEPKSSFAGRFYHVSDAYNFPRPLQQPHPPITVGGSGKQVMLRIVAKYADRWNIPAGYQDLDDLIATLKGHCQAVGRDFDAIEISEQLLLCLGKDHNEVEERWQSAQRMRPFAATAIKGTPDEVIAALKARAARGIRMWTIIFAQPAQPMMELFAREVMPALD